MFYILIFYCVCFGVWCVIDVEFIIVEGRDGFFVIECEKLLSMFL